MTQVSSIERTKFGFNVCTSGTNREVHPFIYTRANFHQACSLFEMDINADYGLIYIDTLIKSLNTGERLECAHGRVFRVYPFGRRQYYHTDGNMYEVTGRNGHCLHIELDGPTYAKVDICKLKKVYGNLEDGIDAIKAAVSWLDAVASLERKDDLMGLNYFMAYREVIDSQNALIDAVVYEYMYAVVDDWTGMVVYESDDRKAIDTYMSHMNKYFHVEENTKVA